VFPDFFLRTVLERFPSFRLLQSWLLVPFNPCFLFLLCPLFRITPLPPILCLREGVQGPLRDSPVGFSYFLLRNSLFPPFLPPPPRLLVCLSELQHQSRAPPVCFADVFFSCSLSRNWFLSDVMTGFLLALRGAGPVFILSCEVPLGIFFPGRASADRSPPLWTWFFLQLVRWISLNVVGNPLASPDVTALF